MFFPVASIKSEPQEKPLSCEEILKLLENHLDQNELLGMLKKHGNNCQLDERMVFSMTKAGANLELIELIKKTRVANSSIIITQPIMNSNVGPTGLVGGTAPTGISEKFLWVFAHRSDLKYWWPQNNSLEIAPSGDWKVGVNYGGPQDIGFDFEIIAIMVDASTNVYLNNYIDHGVNTGDYPGIALAKGEPRSLIVTVHKTSH
jgi:hypothetical protein